MCRDRKPPSPVERRRNEQRRSESWMRRIQKNSVGWRWGGFFRLYRLLARLSCSISRAVCRHYQQQCLTSILISLEGIMHFECMLSYFLKCVKAVNGEPAYLVRDVTPSTVLNVASLFCFSETASLFLDYITDAHWDLCILSYRKLRCGVNRRSLRRSRWRWSKSKWKLCDFAARSLSRRHLQNLNSRGAKTSLTPQSYNSLNTTSH